MIVKLLLEPTDLPGYFRQVTLAAILLVPRARQVVMTAGRPSGMAATASATAI